MMTRCCGIVFAPSMHMIHIVIAVTTVSCIDLSLNNVGEDPLVMKTIYSAVRVYKWKRLHIAPVKCAAIVCLMRFSSEK